MNTVNTLKRVRSFILKLVYPIMGICCFGFLMSGCTKEVNDLNQSEFLDSPVFYVPNAFTPNDSNSNDTFQPILATGVNLDEYRLLVYNRWQEIIFESFDHNHAWDGTYQDQVVEVGVYFWTIEFKESKSSQRKTIGGQFSILR